VGKGKKYRRMQRELDRLRRRLREIEREELLDKINAALYERDRERPGVV